MPDPQILYVVTAVVVLGLVAWVIVVLARSEGNDAPRAPALEPGPKAAEAGHALPSAQRHPTPTIENKDDASAERAKPWMHSYAEIQDEPSESPGPVVDATASPVVDATASPVVDATASPVANAVDEDDSPTGPNALILVTAVGRTDPGLKRTHNEDAYAILEDHHLFVIADGMGRHAAGEVASRLCVEAITEAFRTSSFGPPREPHLSKRAARLRGATLLANERILAAAAATEEHAGMGTTVVSAYFSANNQRAYIAHVGDSRCYRLRDGRLTQLTTDHTLGAEGIKGKTASILSRAIGVEPEVEVDVLIEAPVPGDIYLLCSDGLSRMVEAQEIEATLTSTTDLDEATKVLTDLANRGGGRDNITVILVRVESAKS
jgi:serine/threonine protein phosphatase PrpC